MITYTRKAAAELRARIRAALLERGRDDLARRLDGAWISTIHGFCARLLRAHPFAVGDRPALPRARRRARRGDPRRGVRPRARRVLRDARSPERLRLLATYGTRRLRTMLTGVYETLRSAGRPLDARARGGARLSGRCSRTCARRRDACVDDPAATEPQRGRGAGRSRPPVAARAADSTCRRCARAARAAASFEEARKRVEQAALEIAATRDRELLQELLDLFAAEYASGEGARVGARLRGPAAARTRPAACDDRGPRGRAAPLPHDHGRRVPGHERAPVRADRPARRRAGRGGPRRREGRVLRRRRVPVDLRLPPRRRRGVPAAPRARGAAAAADARTTARGPRCSRPSTTSSAGAFGDGYPAARGVGRVPRPGLRASGRAARHRQGVVSRVGRALAARRGASRRPARPRARRQGRGDARGDRPAVRGRHGRRVVRGGAARARACRPTARRDGATSASSRSSTCSCTCGCCATATTTRRSSPCSHRRSSASRTTRSC